jgi:glycosyltransferase involved in cell wall biosynthesis
MSPRVSVIVNIKDGARFLAAALDSALAQTFTDWELIAWDDCSHDASADIVRRYQDPRVRYFLSPAEIPLAEARAQAIAQARGEWLAFLDQDDLWTPDKLQQQLALASGPEASTVAIVYGRTLVFRDGCPPHCDFDHRHAWRPLPSGRIFQSLFEDSCFIAMSSAMLRRAAVLPLLPIPEEFSLTPDYYLYAELARHYEARAVDTPVCYYRLHGANLSQQRWRAVNEQCLALVERFQPCLPPALVRRRRRVHFTVLAFIDFLQGHPLRALTTVLTRGSISYLLSRPAARAARRFRYKLQTPPWQIR